MKKINLGIVAHVDAGKTTTTEHLLHSSGVLKEIGRVDEGTTQTDSLEIERRRGITIKASAISFNWRETKINLLDTPGHVDFISEVERSLSVLDGAILVVSGAEGVQSQTRILFETLKALEIPTLIFINKLDRLGADSSRVLAEIRSSLGGNFVRLQSCFDEGCREIAANRVMEGEEIIEGIKEAIAEVDEAFLETYLSGAEVEKGELEGMLRDYARQGKVYPVFCGAAFTGMGIEELLDGIVEYLPCAEGEILEKPSGVVFKIDRDGHDEKRTYVRMYEGSFSVRDTMKSEGREEVEKIKKIQLLDNGRIVEASSLSAGDIGIIYGLSNFKIGDVLGDKARVGKKAAIARPMLKTRVSAVKSADTIRLFKVLSQLAEEDPMLELEVDELEKAIYLKLFGEVQMEVIETMLREQHYLEANFSEVMTIYKETPEGKGSAAMRMCEKMNPFWATVGLRIEPGVRGEGLVYSSEVPTGSLPKSFQNAIEEAVFTTARQGLCGWEVTDLKVTLILGEFSSVMSTPADFRDLTPMVFMDALYEAGTQLLEPLLAFELKVPQGVLSKSIMDLEEMRASFETPAFSKEEFLIKGLIPVEHSKLYSGRVASYTEGRGVFVTRFHGYSEVPMGFMKEKQKRLYDPLNKKAYLMHKLNTIRG